MGVQFVAELVCLTSEACEDPLLVAFDEVLVAEVAVGLGTGQHGVDSREHRGGNRDDRFATITPSFYAVIESLQVVLVLGAQHRQHALTEYGLEVLVRRRPRR